MRILFLIDNLRSGGAQKALLAMVRALRAAQGDPRVWCLGGTSEFEEEFRAAGVPVLGKLGSNKLAALREPFALRRYLKREKIELVQTLLFHSDIAGRIAGRLSRWSDEGKRRPVIVSSVRASNLRNRGWQYRLARWTAPLADAFTPVSRRTLEFAARTEGVAAERATVIPNGIDPAEWESLPDAAEARRKLGLPRDAFVVCTLSRLHEQKGMEFLLAAARTVAEQVPSATFLIAGYGPLLERLKEQARQLDVDARVRFLGYRKDVALILAASNVFVLPSLWEGMSNALLEAMAAGKPVIATSVNGAVEQVLPGETGLLVPPRDADALARALLDLAHDPRKALAMGLKGRERVRSEFSLSRMTDAYIELYRRLLMETGKRES
jgi:glycosyltransferase involved in cell wall biosynthesis